MNEERGGRGGIDETKIKNYHETQSFLKGFFKHPGVLAIIRGGGGQAS